MQDLTKMPKDAMGREPLPVSGERVMVTKAGAKTNKPPKPLTNDESNANVRAQRKRSSWEQTPVGQARTTSPFAPGANVAQIHHIDSYDTAPDSGPKIYDRQLPGMSDPNAAPRPAKWEELSDNQRAHTERGLRKFGTSMDKVTSDFGNQLDQAHVRAQGHEAEPYASRFYESGAPRQKIDESARALGISPLLHAQMNAFTSPNTKFSINRADGSTTFPNDEAARHVVTHVQRGGAPETITNKTDETIQLPKPKTSKDPTTEHGKVQGYVTNMRKAAHAMDQHQKGIEPADWEFGPNSKGGFDTSPKTGPYANSWSDMHPQFTVADVHTGGGGAFPHLPTSKALLESNEGTDKVNRDKSGREKALSSVPFAHAAIDHANRTAMTQRNMGSVRRSQAMQWGEEQLQRGEVSKITGNHKDNLRGAPNVEDAYPSRVHRAEVPGQQGLDFRPGAAPRHAGTVDRRSDTAKRLGLDF